MLNIIFKAFINHESYIDFSLRDANRRQSKHLMELLKLNKKSRNIYQKLLIEKMLVKKAMGCHKRR